MLSQQETFKLGEWSPEPGRYACIACDRAGRASTLEIDSGQAFPFCPACKDASRQEPDQLWIRERDLPDWRRREQTRWREILK